MLIALSGWKLHLISCATALVIGIFRPCAGSHAWMSRCSRPTCVCCTEVRGVRYDAKVKACSQTLVRIRPDVGVPEAGWQPYWFRAYASQM
jgi:hypothetical protein